MSQAEEVVRAVEYRRQQVARARFQQSLERKLAGSTAARREGEAAWDPILRRGEGWDPPVPVVKTCRA